MSIALYFIICIRACTETAWHYLTFKEKENIVLHVVSHQYYSVLNCSASGQPRFTSHLTIGLLPYKNCIILHKDDIER